ncbi:GDSL-type esterase/lipase family protein [Acinetobacter baumannii]
MTVPISDRLSQLYVGNGTNIRFDFTFRVFNQEDATGVAIRKKGKTEFETVDPSEYTVTINQDSMGGYVTFSTPPTSTTYFYIAGATPLDQLLDITNYDNFYPDAIERALDKLTALLQEWGSQLDQEKQARILADIQYDSLAMEREENLENRLISYINAVVGITNPKIFDGITDRMVITKDGRTQREFNESIPFWTDDYVNFKQETYLREEQILDHTDQKIAASEVALTALVNSEKDRATAAESVLDAKLNANGVGNRAYKTYADMDADKANIPAKSKVTVTNDPTSSNNGDWQYDGSTFTKSVYDPVQQAKDFANANKIFNPQPVIEPTDFDTLDTLGFRYFFSGATWDSSPNKPPINNQWAYMLTMPVSGDVVAQYVWAFNSQKILYRFRNSSRLWSSWLTFSDDSSLTTAIENSVNIDLNGTFDARTINSTTPNFENLTKNLFDKKAPLLLNRRIDQYGELEKHQKSVTTSLINVQGLASIAVSGLQASTQAYRAYRFLDKDKKLIDNDPIDLNKTSVVIPVPANSVFFQVCLKDGIDTWDLNLDTIQIESGTAATTYATYVRGYLKTLFGANFLVDPFQVRSILNPAFENLSRNFFDKTAPLLMNRRITSSGVLEYHLNSVTTMPVYVKGLSSMAVSGLTASSIAYRAYRFLDKDQKWISNDPILLNRTSQIIPVPENAVYFQLCLKDGIDTWALNLDTIQFESGTIVSPYESYIRGNLKSLYGADIARTTQSASKAYGASVAIVGDSISETSNVDNGIVNQPTYRIQWPTTLFEKLTPVKFSNYAKSGASFKESGQTNQWQMISHQINMMIANQENPDIIIVAMGTNDMNPKENETTPNFEKIGDYDTAMSKTTLASLDRTLSLEAARWAFWTIRKNFPNAVCFYANPLQRALATSEVLAPFVEGFSKLALRHGFNLIDQHHELGIVHELEKSIGNGQFLADGLHPNATGKVLQANYILSKVIARMTY